MHSMRSTAQRASPADMHSTVTLKGEQGAMPMRSIEYLPGEAVGWRVS